MRKITSQAVNAFMNHEKFSQSNTQVRKETFGYALSLHGNDIAMYNTEYRTISISNAGWFSNTTKERLNGIPGVRINQKAGVWYLNGKQWNGEWITL